MASGQGAGLFRNVQSKSKQLFNKHRCIHITNVPPSTEEVILDLDLDIPPHSRLWQLRMGPPPRNADSKIRKNS